MRPLQTFTKPKASGEVTNQRYVGLVLTARPHAHEQEKDPHADDEHDRDRVVEESGEQVDVGDRVHGVRRHEEGAPEGRQVVAVTLHRLLR